MSSQSLARRPHRRHVRPVYRYAWTLVVAAFGATVLFACRLSAQALVPTFPLPGSGADTIVLSIQTVRQLVAQYNPNYRGALEGVSAARGVLRQTKLPQFNPELDVQLPGGGRNASPYQLTLSQEFEWAGQRGLRVGAAQSALSRVTSEVQDATQRLLTEASLAYYRAVATAERLRVAEEQISLTNRLLAAVRIQTQEGEISAFESSLAEIEGARAHAHLLASQREANRALAELTRLVGLAPGTPVTLYAHAATDTLSTIPSTQLVLDTLTALALGRRPDLAAAQARIAEADRLSTLAKREALPNLRVGVLAERIREGADRTHVGATLGLSVPLFNRNQGLRDQRSADVRRAAFDARAVELQIRTEVAEAIRSFETASEEATVFATSILAPARENSAKLEMAYTSGKISLPSLLLLRNQLLDAELGYWDAWFTRESARIQLEAVIGAFTSSPIRHSPSSQ